MADLILFFLFLNEHVGCTSGYKEAFTSGDQEPWVFRGGLQAEFQVCMPMATTTTFSATLKILVPDVATDFKI